MNAIEKMVEIMEAKMTKREKILNLSIFSNSSITKEAK